MLLHWKFSVMLTLFALYITVICYLGLSAGQDAFMVFRTIEVYPLRSVVAHLIAEPPKNVNYRLFIDYLFTSLLLIEHLSKLGIGGTGTSCHNRTEKDPLMESQAMKKSKEVPSLKSLTKHLVQL